MTMKFTKITEYEDKETLLTLLILQNLLQVIHILTCRGYLSQTGGEYYKYCLSVCVSF